jgi:lipopolysaccharide export system permease protein
LFGILHRTIFFELVKVFVLSLIGITGIIVMAAIVVEASQRGYGPAQILEAIPLLVPSMMPFIIPPTTLFTSCVVYGRLSHDNEIIAIKAAGINVLHVIWPGIFLGAVMSVATFGLFIHLIPYTHLLLRTAIASDVEEFLYTMLKRDRQIRRRPDLKISYEMWCEQVQGRQLKNAIFKKRDDQGRYDAVAKARDADLRVDMNKRLVVIRMRHGTLLNQSGDRVHFEDKDFSVPLPTFDKQLLGTRDMTWQELLDDRQATLADKDERRATMDQIKKDNGGRVPVNADHQVQEALQNLQKAEQKLRNLETEIHMRPAQSFGCLFFVLVGCPVGIWFSRSDYLSAFISCFLPIVFLYYPLQLCATNLAKDGKLYPVLALWLANLAMGIIALGLFRRLLKN